MSGHAMPFERWEPAYEAIRSDFGYDRADDERARDVLVSLLSSEEPLSLDDVALPGTVVVCGAAPSLSEELDVVDRADTVVAASTAADVVRDAGLAVDCMVTDLDKNPDVARELTDRGVPVAVHAHGDNVDALRRYVPSFGPESILPTTQVAPVPPVVNVGGFTDGDRAAFLASAAGADRLLFAGWEFDDPTVSTEKARKLLWAERLLYWLERERGERFSVLKGRRNRIELPWLS